MRVLVAPDGFGGTLTAAEAADAVASGWRSQRPTDRVEVLPLSDGGEGLLDAVRGPADRIEVHEVAGPLGHPHAGRLLWRDATAVVEVAEACGLALVPPAQRDPTRTTSYGVGQLIGAALAGRPSRVVVGLGGSATVDGGAGALTALGFRLRVGDGSGLKIGGGQLATLASAAAGWFPGTGGTPIELLADVQTPLSAAAATFGPQKGADQRQVAELAAGLERLADVLERDLGAVPDLRTTPGTGAAGGLGYGLAAALTASVVPGAARVATLLGLDEALAAADVVVTGEGRLDATTRQGKVVDHVVRRAAEHGVPCLGLVGQQHEPLDGLVDVEAAAPDGPGPDPAAEVAAAARRLAARR